MIVDEGITAMAEPNHQQLQEFTKEIMRIERLYANELKHSKSNRQNDIREYLERFAAKELDE